MNGYDQVENRAKKDFFKSPERFGIYRSRVVEVGINNNEYGEVRVLIPSLSSNSNGEEETGLIAYPANNCFGGYNSLDPNQTSYYASSSYTPTNGSWWWVFFEGNDRQTPFYFAPCQKTFAKLPPECQGGSATYLIAKSNQGRAIVVSDDSGKARTEITGKKRNMSGGPEGDSSSTMKVSGNQSIISIDESGESEKIIVQLHNGNRVVITENQIGIHSGGDINIKAGGNLNIEAQNINIKANGDLITSGGGTASMNGNSTTISSGGPLTLYSGATAILSGATAALQQGGSAASDASGSSPASGRS